MNDYKIGKAILELRKHFNISQRELAKDLCDQSLISRIEKNEIYPSAPLLYELAKRLGVDINYFFTDQNKPTSTLDYVEEFCKQVRHLINRRQYEEVFFMIKREEKSPLFRRRQTRRFILWAKGVCTFYLEDNHLEAIAYIDEALSIHETTQKNYCEEEIEILISKAILYSEKNDYKEAVQIFLEALHHFKRLPFSGDTKIEMRLYYNISKSYFQQKQFQESIEYARKGIYQGIQSQQFYLLGHLYYQKGEAYLYLEKRELAISNMKEALWLFEKTKQKVLFDYVTQEIEKISSNVHPKDYADVR